MATFLGKAGGTWKEAQSFSAKVAGSWAPAKKAWVKISGVWELVWQKDIVPLNMIVLYYDSVIPIDALICDGTNDTPNLLNKFIRGSVNPLTLGGSLSHLGTEHGVNNSVDSSTYTHGTAAYSDSISTATNVTSHNHTAGSHTHGGTITIKDSIDKINVIPTIGGSTIGKNALMLSINNTYLSSWIALAVSNYYLYLKNTTGIEDAILHTHDATAPELNEKNFTDLAGSQGTTQWISRHRHSLSHNMNNAKIEPSRYSIYGYRNDNNSISFSELPSGTVAIFTTSDLPVGWIAFSEANNRLLSISQSTGAGGSSHSHGTKTVSSSGVINTSTRRASTGSVTRRVIDHTHTYADTHQSLDITPEYVNFFIGVKQ